MPAGFIGRTARRRRPSIVGTKPERRPACAATRRGREAGTGRRGDAQFWADTRRRGPCDVFPLPRRSSPRWFGRRRLTSPDELSRCVEGASRSRKGHRRRCPWARLPTTPREPAGRRETRRRGEFAAHGMRGPTRTKTLVAGHIAVSSGPPSFVDGATRVSSGFEPNAGGG